MKNILISPKIISDKYGQLGHFLDLSWKDFFKNRANIFTTITNNTKFLNNIKIDGIIFSGGNNLHLLEKKKENLIRDKFEVELLKFSLKNSIPIIAVCRGFQFVNSYFGGKLQKTKNHVKKNHKIIFKKKELSFNENEILTVNSFHNYKIESLAKNFISIANSNDDSIEMAYARKQKILGLMFHPERKNISQLKINQLVFKYFKI